MHGASLVAGAMCACPRQPRSAIPGKVNEKYLATDGFGKSNGCTSGRRLAYELLQESSRLRAVALSEEFNSLLAKLEGRVALRYCRQFLQGRLNVRLAERVENLSLRFVVVRYVIQPDKRGDGAFVRDICQLFDGLMPKFTNRFTFCNLNKKRNGRPFERAVANSFDHVHFQRAICNDLVETLQCRHRFGIGTVSKRLGGFAAYGEVFTFVSDQSGEKADLSRKKSEP